MPDFARAQLRRQRANFALFLGPALLLLACFFVAPVIVDLVLAFTDMDRTLAVATLHARELRAHGHARHAAARRRSASPPSSSCSTLGIFNVTFALLLALVTTAVPQTAGRVLPRGMAAAADEPVGRLCAAVAVGGRSRTSAGCSTRSSCTCFGMAPIDLRSNHPLLVIILANGFIGASLGMIIFTSAIRSIPEHLFHAARADGAGSLAIVRHSSSSRAALADLLHDDPPDAVAAGELRVHPADHRRRPVLRHDGVLALCLPARVRERPVRVRRGALAHPHRGRRDRGARACGD